MKSVTVNSYAKINLSLDVLGQTDDGFHEVAMVMQQIMLHDDVLVRFSSRAEQSVLRQEAADALTQNAPPQSAVTIELSTNRSYLPRDERNLAYRAAALMAARYGVRRDLTGGKIRIDIKKRIPVGAGLAGGSGNAAAVLHALNRLWNLHLSVAELAALGSELGSDVPFCIMGQARCNPTLPRYLRGDSLASCAALAEGRGTALSPVSPLRASVVLVKPSFSVSTREVYQHIDCELALAAQRDGCLRRPDSAELIAGLSEGNSAKVIGNMINLLELYTLKKHPRVREIKDFLASETEAAAVLMSGSGPTVYGLYFDKGAARRAYRRVQHLSRETYLTTTTW